jgi:hypothetical protein
MVNVTPADVSDSAGAQTILDAIRKRWPRLKHLFADAGHDRTKLMGVPEAMIHIAMGAVLLCRVTHR